MCWNLDNQKKKTLKPALQDLVTMEEKARGPPDDVKNLAMEEHLMLW